MGRFGFVGPSYVSQSGNADDERTLNWYPERLEGAGKSVYALYPTPGLKNIGTISSNLNLTYPIEAMVFQPGPNFSSPVWGVSGTSYFRIFYSGGGVFSPSGLAVTPFPRPGINGVPVVQMTAGPGFILMTVDGNVYSDNGGGIVPVAAANFNSLPVSQVGYCDGFFLALNANSNQWYASAPLDPNTWPGTSTAKVSVFPDNVVAMVVNQRQVWMLGQTASVVYYNSGNSPFPFDVIQGSYMEAGCIAAASATKLDNSIFWLGADARGAGMVWRASGYTPQRISNHAVEFAMQGYPTISDAIGYAYQDQGHSFYQLYFPSANGGKGATWVYDAATGLWHEKAFLNPDGSFSAHRSRCHVFWNAREPNTGLLTPYHLVGDWQATGNIYQMAIPSPNGAGGWNFVNDFGNPIQRLRRAPAVNLENEWVFHHEMEVDLETGLGPIPPLLDGNGVARAPQIMLRWSDDGGHTWSNQRIIGAGQGGNYKTRAVFRRLGRSRQRIYEVSASDPVPWRIVDAYLKADPAYQAEERMSTRLAKSA